MVFGFVALAFFSPEMSFGSLYCFRFMGPNNLSIKASSSSSLIRYLRVSVDAFGIIVKHLGVKEFETTYATEVISEREISVNGEIGYKVLNTNAEVKITNNDTKTAKYHRHEKFSGNFTEDSYLKAIEQAKLFGLNDDRDIAYLLEVRNPTDNNLLTSRYVTFELTEEINKKIDIAFSLSSLNLFKIGSKYNETLKTKKTITIKSNLIF